MNRPHINGRRQFLLTGAVALAAAKGALGAVALPGLQVQQVNTDTLAISCAILGPEHGRPVVLVHDLGYDIRSFAAAAGILADAGLRVIVPSLRGHGATRYRSEATPRSGQQAALGRDLLDLIDALHIPEAVFAGFGWGASAACAMAALRPSRCVGLVLANNEGIDDAAAATTPLAPAAEAALWHQFYFQTERGRQALQTNRIGVMREVWRHANRDGRMDEAAFAQAAASFDNPDFIETVLHAWRYRFGNADPDPRYVKAELTVAARKAPTVPVIALEGGASARQPARLAQSRVLHIAAAGHDLPREAPQAFADAVLGVTRAAVWRT
ncbi:alpha/beta fold hydrolase [Massilia sp. CF038]|uniref:alpha/beta fold hydrolase n=1 Tax=Massilia sp. CF038 TaxID=1881045 RepID=UPI00091D7D20|nr:alpha/beta hydrolase [Massilia sp. CF038]SHG71923.1 Pimeloyl-ACP methyl ester carboxylesterase [Massilia sp. CF038]